MIYVTKYIFDTIIILDIHINILISNDVYFLDIMIDCISKIIGYLFL